MWVPASCLPAQVSLPTCPVLLAWRTRVGPHLLPSGEAKAAPQRRGMMAVGDLHSWKLQAPREGAISFSTVPLWVPGG